MTDNEPTDEKIMQIASYLNEVDVPTKGRKLMDEDGVIWDIPDEDTLP